MSEPTLFSTIVRERASASHSQSEHTGFMSELLKGDGTREDYAALVAQHYFIYEALEGGEEAARQDPTAAAFITDKLTRLPALEVDLEHLFGADWREQITALPATQRYVDRLKEVGTSWPGGFVAHHYTRYLGDLSGGVFIGRAMKRRFGFEDAGATFYTFGDIANVHEFKDEYRQLLDAAAWDDAEKERFVEEVLVAYQFNTDLFIELENARQPA